MLRCQRTAAYPSFGNSLANTTALTSGIFSAFAGNKTVIMQIKSKRSWGFVFAAIATVLAACSGSNSAVAPAPSPCGTPPGVTQSVLVYPALGATSVPDAFGQIVVGSTSSIPANWGVTIVNAFGASANGNAFTTAPSPLPTPNQTPSFSNPVYQSSSFGTLSV